MITLRSPSAHVNYWRKLGNTSPKTGIDCCSDESVWYSAYMQAPGGEVDVVPAQCHQLRGAEAVAVSDQDRRGVPMPRAVLLGGGASAAITAAWTGLIATELR
jgi:hypothetical protein